MILLIIPPEIQSIQQFRLFFTAELHKNYGFANTHQLARVTKLFYLCNITDEDSSNDN